MIIQGSVVNAAAIVAGSLLGMLLHDRFPDRVRVIVFQGLGLSTLALGMGMALKNQDLLVIIFSLLLGGISGELMRLDVLFERLGDKVKGLVRSKNTTFTDGLITASLIYCIGAMAIIGSLEEGINGDPTILYTKSLLDGFASIALASTYGSGVAFSAIPVFLYQGGLTIFAGFFQELFSQELIAQLSATGGLLIVGIGINLLDLKDIKIANLLPSLVVVVVLTLLVG